jgi:hypothetical protein
MRVVLPVDEFGEMSRLDLSVRFHQNFTRQPNGYHITINTLHRLVCQIARISESCLPRNQRKTNVLNFKLLRRTVKY